MTIKDILLSWYIQHILIPRIEIIDRPGFIVTQASGRGRQTYLRVLLLPEQLFVNLEMKTIEEKGEEGKQALYNTGKRFGWSWASLSGFPTIKTASQSELTQFADFLVTYVGVTYASKATHTINLKTQHFLFKAKNYIICRKNGQGYIMTAGGISGIWAYMMNNPMIEGIQQKCSGRGDEWCEVLCAPTEFLEANHFNFNKMKELSDIKLSKTYIDMNKIRETTYAKNSLKDLINAGLFRYEGGVMSYKDDRYFLCESHLIYILEEEMRKLNGGEKILFDVAFNYGKELAKGNEKNYSAFITHYISALGWGDVVSLRKEGKCFVYASHYPWIWESKNPNFTLFRGMVSGILSGSLGREVILEKIKTDISRGSLSIGITERD